MGELGMLVILTRYIRINCLSWIINVELCWLVWVVWTCVAFRCIGIADLHVAFEWKSKTLFLCIRVNFYTQTYKSAQKNDWSRSSCLPTGCAHPDIGLFTNALPHLPAAVELYGQLDMPSQWVTLTGGGSQHQAEWWSSKVNHTASPQKFWCVSTFFAEDCFVGACEARRRRGRASGWGALGLCSPAFLSSSQSLSPHPLAPDRTSRSSTSSTR